MSRGVSDGFITRLRSSLPGPVRYLSLLERVLAPAGPGASACFSQLTSPPFQGWGSPAYIPITRASAPSDQWV